MAADHQLEPGQPDHQADVLANAIAALRAVLQLHFRDPADLDEVVQSACVRLVQAIRKAGTVDSPAGFLHSVWREERAMLLRERARRQRLGEAGDLPVEELALAAAADGFTEEEIRSIGAALPGSLGAWLLDHVSGRSDEDLAARDGVTTAAIRQRWRQLRGYFLAEGVLPKILDFLLTNRGSRASIGLRPPEIGSPPTPNPQPPTPNPQLRKISHDRAILRLFGVPPECPRHTPPWLAPLRSLQDGIRSGCWLAVSL
jgi:DNA-directed RNA polymerase specialized sigma24 family protein